MSNNIDDLLEEIEILKGYKHMYQKINEQNKRYRKIIEKVELTAQIKGYDDVYNFLVEALEGEG